MEDLRSATLKSDHEEWSRFRSLRGFVRLILCVDWDPIDLLGTPETLNEYDSCASEIAELLERGATQSELVAHLKQIQMCKVPESRTELVAEKLLRVHQTFLAAQPF